MTAPQPEIPAIGFGTFPLEGAAAQAAVEEALALGFRHIDTAQMYGNEAAVGAALAASGVARDALFVVTKVMPDDFHQPDILSSVRQSLDRLGLDRVDLLLVHWPPLDLATETTVDRLVEAHAAGLTTQIGVSNFNIAMMERAAAHASIPIATNQIEFHPLLDQSAVLAAAQRLGIRLTAYCPLARGAALKDETVISVAERIGRTPAQVVLRWIVQQGVVAISMSTKPANMTANLEVAAFDLSTADMAAVTGCTARNMRLVDPAGMAPAWDA